MKLKLYRFQRVGVRRMWRFGNNKRLCALLADDMGTGKTVQALFAVWKYLPDDRPIVVLCPAGLKDHWKQEALHHLGMRAEILNGRKPPSKLPFKIRNNCIYIVSPEILGSPLGKTWNKFLKNLQPQAVLVDEGHMYCNSGAQRSKNLKALMAGVRNRVIITGTPTTDLPYKIWFLIHLLKPKIFPSYIRFLWRYCKPTMGFRGMEYKGATRLKELHRILKEKVMIRRLKDDVLKDLPPKIRSVVPIRMAPKEAKEYYLAEKDFAKWMMKTYPRRSNKAIKQEKMLRYGYLVRLAGRLSMKAKKEWIDNYLTDCNYKLIVFGVHKVVVKGFHAMYPGTSVRVDGSVTKDKRWNAINSFKGKKKIRLFFGNIKAAGVGWSATGVPAVAFAEMGDLPADHTQAEDRVRGLKRGVKGMSSMAYYLTAVGTVEESKVKKLNEKQKKLDRMLDGKKTEGLGISMDETMKLADQVMFKYFPKKGKK